MADLELELTYLAKKIPSAVASVTPTRIEDVYVPSDLTKHAKLRIRRLGNTYAITKKVPVNESDSSLQLEHTIDIDKDEFNDLRLVSSRRVVKDRYVVQLAGRTAEVDVFLNDLEGLVVLDFEFDTEEEKATFVAPNECLVGVTQELFIAGGMLAGKTYKDIEPELHRLNYKFLKYGSKRD